MGRPLALPEGAVERIVSYMSRDWFLPPPESGSIRPSEAVEGAMSNGSSTAPSCDECGARGVALRQCSGCRTAHYCSRLCQSQAWPKHKKRCKKSIRKRKGAAKLKKEGVRVVACGASPATTEASASASGVSGCGYVYLAALLLAVIAVYLHT